jgi:hypothetical protein
MPMGTGFRCVAVVGFCSALAACGRDAHSADEGEENGGSSIADAGQSSAGSAQGGSAGAAPHGGSGGGAGGVGVGVGGTLSGGAGGSAGAGQTEGGAPQVPLHTCPVTPEPACPTKVHTGAVTVIKDSDITALEGVTSIEGDFVVLEGKGFDALHCLETVTGNVEISGAIFSDDNLWGLRNLKTVGRDLRITGGQGRFYIDCAFRELENLGSDHNTDGSFDGESGLTGELDVSKLTRLRHFRIGSSDLTHISLPHSGIFEMTQLFVEDEPHLTDIDGFDAVTLTMIPGLDVTGFDSARFVNDPQLSECKAQAIAKLFLDAGFEAKSVVVMGNAPCIK